MTKPPLTKLVTDRVGKDSRVYLIKNNRKQWVTSIETILDLGLAWEDIRDIDTETLANLPTDIPMTTATQTIYDNADYIYCIEKNWSDNFNVGITGWAVGKKKPVKALTISIDGQRKKIINWEERPEIFDYFSTNTKFPVQKACGFSLVINRVLEHRFEFKSNSVGRNLIYAPSQTKRRDPPPDKNLQQRFRDIVNKDKLSVLEIGSRVSPGGTNKRPHFKNASLYTGFDYHPGKLVDVVGDAHQLSKHFNKKFDALYSESVLEHLAAPWKAVIEMNKVLKKGGYVYHSVPSCWVLHDMPWDFWRFSDAGLKSLFSKAFGFRVIDVEYVGPVNIHWGGDASDSLARIPLSPAYSFVSILAQKIKDINRLQTRFNFPLKDMIDKDTEYPLWDN